MRAWWAAGLILAACVAAARAEDERGFDVVHYDLAIEVEADSIRGDVTLGARAVTDGLREVVLDLSDSLRVPFAASPTHGLSSTVHGGDLLHLTLANPVAAGDSFAVVVHYHGTPPPIESDEVAGLPFTFTTHGSANEGTLAPMIYTISATDRAGAWWPCKDVLTDRATCDVTATVAPGLVAVSNGRLVSVETLPDQRLAYHWRHRHPIATYLVSLAITNYVTLESQAHVQVGGAELIVPLRWFVYPENVEAATFDFARVPEALEFLSTIFGPYPFADEKYAMAAARYSAAMEHQTCTTLNAGYIRGDRFYEWIFVHELAHQWFGDAVGLADWRDVWLNEGFATYAEALWQEHLGGMPAYLSYVHGFDPMPRGQPDFSGTVYDPAPLFGDTPYHKGAYILHMLRHEIGDDAFFAALRAYADQYAQGRTVTTEDFVNVAEAQSGRDLTAFFDQWLNREGRPMYQWQAGWQKAASGYDITARIVQTQEGDPYQMPIDIRATLYQQQQDVTFVADDVDPVQEFTYHVTRRPLDLEFDPDGWILRGEIAPFAARALLRPPRPNPAIGPSVITYVLPAESVVTLRVYDALGRRVRTLVDARTQAREQAIEWDGTDDGGRKVGPGMYFVDLTGPGFEAQTKLVRVR